MKISPVAVLLFVNMVIINAALAQSADTEQVDISKIGKISDEFQTYDDNKSIIDILNNQIKTRTQFDGSKISKVYSGDTKTFSHDQYFIVAKVNSDIITNIDIMNSIRFIFFSSGKLFDEKNASLMIPSVLTREISNKVQEQVAEKNHMRIPDSIVNKRVREIAERNGMTVQELEQKFQELGISMPVFKTNIASRMLFSTIVEAIKNDVVVTPNENKEERRQIIESNKSTRYKLYEIHLMIQDAKHKAEVMKNAQMIIKLIDEGFNFPVLAESVSQGNYKLQVGDLGWVSERNMEESVKSAVVKLKIGQHTNIIETNSGIKIIYLEDKAAPNKVGSSEGVYKYMKVSMKYRGEGVSSDDARKVEKAIDDLKAAKNPNEFKKVCQKYNLGIEEKEETLTNPFMAEILESAEVQASTVQSFENEDYVDVYRTVGKTIPDITPPTDEEIDYAIIAKKGAKLFQRNIKQAESSAFIECNADNIKRLTKKE